MNDDLQEICARSGIDLRTYRSFPSALRAKESGEPRPTETRDAAPLESAAGVHRTFPVQPNQYREPERVTHSGPRWSVLKNVLDGRPDDTRDEHRGGVHRTSRPVQMAPAAGGVGVTTIAATLARVFSGRGESVLIVDHVAGSMLPFYFGGAEILSGRCSFIGSREGDAGTVSMIAVEGEIEEPRPADHVFDLTAELGDPSSGEELRVVVVVPDLHSMVKLASIEQRTRGQEPYYLLNRFDNRVPLHNDVRSWLSQQLKHRLLPVTIRRADEVTQALAEGRTVIDDAPNSGVAEDFWRLAEWFRSAQWNRAAASAAGR